MSDALSDIAVDQTRSERFEKFLTQLIAHLSSPTNESREAVIVAAKAIDRVGRGYWGGPTNLVEGLDEQIRQLEQNNPVAWSEMLFLAQHSPQMRRLKAISPFKDRLLVFANYGEGFVTFSGELERTISDTITRFDMKTYDCDKYVVALPPIDFATCEVHWVACGIPGQDKPRKAVG